MTDIKRESFGCCRNSTIHQTFLALQRSDLFHDHPLRVRIAFQRVAAWLPARPASIPIIEINASFTKMLRDKAARERGWKFGNYTLLLLQAIIKAAIDAGALCSNRVKQVPKLLPPPPPPSTCRRRIRPVRQPTYSSVNLLKRENSSV
jgi:hypothetical protein